MFCNDDNILLACIWIFCWSYSNNFAFVTEYIYIPVVLWNLLSYLPAIQLLLPLGDDSSLPRTVEVLLGSIACDALVRWTGCNNHSSCSSLSVNTLGESLARIVFRLQKVIGVTAVCQLCLMTVFFFSQGETVLIQVPAYVSMNRASVEILSQGFPSVPVEYTVIRRASCLSPSLW